MICATYLAGYFHGRSSSSHCSDLKLNTSLGSVCDEGGKRTGPTDVSVTPARLAFDEIEEEDEEKDEQRAEPVRSVLVNSGDHSPPT